MSQLCSVPDCSLAESNEEDIIESESCMAYHKAKDALRQFFKYDKFRPGKMSALMAVLHGRDVVVKMATGAGKTLCFFLVPLAIGPSTVTIVISPLNCIMEQLVLEL